MNFVVVLVLMLSLAAILVAAGFVILVSLGRK
jgi:hypothetical protein